MDDYERLARALGALPNGFPRTLRGTEIRILKKIFTPEEAFLASQLSREKETPETIASRLGVAEEEIAARLKAMAKRGMIILEIDRDSRSMRYRLAPFVVGIYEASVDIMDHELAHLVEDYMVEGGAAGIMGRQPAVQRVVPARQALPTEWILPYEDVAQIIDQSKLFIALPCICRTQQDQVGRKCDFPVQVCLYFSNSTRPPKPGDISKAEALALLDKCEELGLVHTVSNVVKGHYYVCNCCGCCCALLRGINEWGIENSVAKASYLAEIDAQLCTGCGVCTDRCQVHAISEEDGIAAVDAARCIGCGLCVTGCSTGAALLNKRPDWETIHPPETFADWEQQRLLAVSVDDATAGEVVGR